MCTEQALPDFEEIGFQHLLVLFLVVDFPDKPQMADY